MNSNTKERLPQLDLFRAFAILSVIQVHATSVTMMEQSLSPSLFYLYNWANIFFKFGVTSFIFLSGFVLFYNYYDKRMNRSMLGRFYRKRMVGVVIPYIFVSLCYYALCAWQNGSLMQKPISDQLRMLGEDLINGTAYTHLYFIFIMIQFYLLFPLLLWLLQRLRNKTFWMAMVVPVGLGVQWAFYFWNKYQLHLPNKGSYAPTYLSYFLLGAVLAIHYEKIREWLSTGRADHSAKVRTATALLWAGWAAVTLYHIQMWYELRRGIHSASTLQFEILWVLNMLLSAMILLHAAFRIYRHFRSFWVKMLTRLGELSFAIYLFHPVVLREYRLVINSRFTFDPNSWTYLFYIVGGSLAALFVSWVFVQVCFKRLPFASWFLGTVPLSLRRKSKGFGESSQDSVA